MHVKKITDAKEVANGGHKMLVFAHSYEQLLKTLGEPFKRTQFDYPDDSGKTDVRWEIVGIDETMGKEVGRVQIWNFKNGPAYLPGATLEGISFFSAYFSGPLGLVLADQIAECADRGVVLIDDNKKPAQWFTDAAGNVRRTIKLTLEFDTDELSHSVAIESDRGVKLGLHTFTDEQGLEEVVGQMVADLWQEWQTKGREILERELLEELPADVWSPDPNEGMDLYDAHFEDTMIAQPEPEDDRVF